MKNYLGDIIYQSRLSQKQTQDQYATIYGISGPAVFKFEKGYVRPSLDLWLKMAAGANVTDRRAVLLWLKSKLPERFQEYIELQGAVAAETGSNYQFKPKAGRADYSKREGRAALLVAAAGDKDLPQGILDLLGDDELWALYKPTGAEINLLRDVFGPLGKGSKGAYREALCLVREFSGTEKRMSQ